MKYKFKGPVRSVWNITKKEACIFQDGVFETEDEETAKFLREQPILTEVVEPKKGKKEA